MARIVLRTGAKRRRQAGGGMTLVELLIVMAIMMLLMATGLKLARPAFQGRKVRETSRQLNAFLAGAKARAVERGRPFGVWFERTPGNLNQCLEVFQCEVPPPYVGDVLDARATFVFDAANNFWRVVFDTQLTTNCASLYATYGPLVPPGNTFWIRFDYRGDLYTVVRLQPDMPSDGTLGNDFRLLGTPPPAPPNGLNFQIYLPPRKSQVTPLDLSNGTAIDLSLSGLGATGTEFDAYNPGAMAPVPSPDPNPVIVLFGAGGQVELVYSRGVASSPLNEVHFLVGRNETIAPLDFNNPTGPPNPRDTRNMQDQDNLWVTVGHRTGSITTAENYFNAAAPTLDVCRQFARSAQTKGGG